MFCRCFLNSFSVFPQCFWGNLLSQVLKSLEGSVWDDASIDGLLAAADESGDGELQVEESIFLPSPANS